MKTRNRISIVIGFFIVATIFYCGCGHKGLIKDSKYPDGKFFNKPYDTVWQAVHELLFVDLGCVEKEVNRKKGVIETDWITRMTTDGTQRWKIDAEIKAKENGAVVYIIKDIEMREEISRETRNYKEKSKDQNPNAGWKNIDVDQSSVDSMYQQLENKLR